MRGTFYNQQKANTQNPGSKINNKSNSFSRAKISV